LRGGDIATENARPGATGPIDLLDTESAIAVRDDLAADRSVSLFKPLGGRLAAAGEVSQVRPPTSETPHREVALHGGEPSHLYAKDFKTESERRRGH
jgi:hypothetical protein